MSRIGLDVKKPRSGFPSNGAQLFLTVFLTVSRVSFEYTKIAYRVPSVKRCKRARQLMNSNEKEEKNCQGVKTRVEPRYNNKSDNGQREVSGEKVVEKCH